MKKLLILCSLLSMFAQADTLDLVHVSDHGFVNPLQNPQDFCYPPSGQKFSDYFSNDRCYYRFNNDCDHAGLVVFDPRVSPNQSTNKNFFTLCNTTDSSQKLGPEMLLYVDPSAVPNQFTVDACVLLPNKSSTEPNQASLEVFYDPSTTPDPSIHVPGCGPNEIGILELQYPHPTNPPTYQMICQSVTTKNETVQTVVIDNLSSLLNGKYTQCPTH